MHIGYCGNVHPGRTIEEVKTNLTQFSLAVKEQVRPDQAMGIGLWLSATAASELYDNDALCRFRDWLAERGLLPYTLNGFPFGDFHQAVVKHNVYLPTWAEPERLDYTNRLAKILDGLLPEGIEGTISTLPLGWPIGESHTEDDSFWKACSKNLKTCAERLNDIVQSSGRNITLCIEPEPGCILDTADDVVDFFERHLLAESEQTSKLIRQHVGVCHDVCHSAVMFEEQSHAVDVFKNAGIRIGKVQVSSAVDVDFDSGDNQERLKKLEQLKTFSEPKYLHQTSIRGADGESQFFEDLNLAIDSVDEVPSGQWRVHFHVPIYLSELDAIGTTQKDILTLVEAIKDSGEPLPHFEVETYAWNVLPEHLREVELAGGIARELKWFDRLL